MKMSEKLKSAYKSWAACTRGVTAVEYGIFLGGMGIALILGVRVFSPAFNDMMQTLSDYLNSLQ